MKTSTIIFRTTPEKKQELKAAFDASHKAVRDAYYNDSRIYGGKAWDRWNEHPKSLGEWVEACALVESAARIKNLKALKGKKK